LEQEGKRLVFEVHSLIDEVFRAEFACPMTIAATFFDPRWRNLTGAFVNATPGKFTPDETALQRELHRLGNQMDFTRVTNSVVCDLFQRLFPTQAEVYRQEAGTADITRLPIWTEVRRYTSYYVDAFMFKNYSPSTFWSEALVAQQFPRLTPLQRGVFGVVLS
jgi:hypothetical protein